MENLFNENDVKILISKYYDIHEDIVLRIYTSRLIGRDSRLVLHGGGNTSVKTKIKDIFGDQQDILFIKGSGHDLSIIEPSGFVGLDLNAVQRLRNLKSLSDEDMENQLKIRKINAQSPDPSVETLLHAFLPHKYIEHTHADSILTLTNLKDGENIIKEALGSKISVIPYIHPGFLLARRVFEVYEANPDIEAVIISYHGIFTFGDDARISYGRMIDYVSRAEEYIKKNQITPTVKHSLSESFPPLSSPLRGEGGSPSVPPFGGEGGSWGWGGGDAARLAQALRGACAWKDHTGKLRRFYTEIRALEKPLEVYVPNSSILKSICRSGVLTPDHVIRTKNSVVYIDRVPENDEELIKLVKDGVAGYQEEYLRYFSARAGNRTINQSDTLPRVCLIQGQYIAALGMTRKDARIAADIAEHTFRVKIDAATIGEYKPISDDHVFDMEYWQPQLKKLSKIPVMLPLQGQIALVTGAAGAIGFGIADRLMAAGASVVLCDIDKSGLEKVHYILTKRYGENAVDHISFDITDFCAVENALSQISRNMGGVDILVPNAGIAYVSKIEDLETEKLRQVTEVNLIGTFNVIKAAIPVFRRQGTGGNIVVVSTKNVFDPGAAFGAYSASKAAAHQLSKIAALELASLGVRVNMVNPDAVFGDEAVPSKLWEMIGPERMKARGLDPDGLKAYYRDRNLLKASVTAEHVGNAVVFFASDLTPTTGATLPVDGGVPAAFPR